MDLRGLLLRKGRGGLGRGGKGRGGEGRLSGLPLHIISVCISPRARARSPPFLGSPRGVTHTQQPKFAL